MSFQQSYGRPVQFQCTTRDLGGYPGIWRYRRSACAFFFRARLIKAEDNKSRVKRRGLCGQSKSKIGLFHKLFSFLMPGSTGSGATRSTSFGDVQLSTDLRKMPTMIQSNRTHTNRHTRALPRHLSDDVRSLHVNVQRTPTAPGGCRAQNG